jgi:Contractile injection system tube protein
MALEKLRIVPQDRNLSEVVALFNPNSYSISKSVEYQQHRRKELNAPLLSFVGGGSRTLSLQLFFDVTEQPRVDGRPVNDVRELTNKLVDLARITRNSMRPPVCRVFWGSSRLANSDFPFTGVVASLQQEFTLFNSSGTPLRANVSVSFTEFLGWGKDAERDQRKTDPEFTTRTVRRDDRLDRLAADLYGDAGAWRVLAEANNIDNPRHLEIGKSLRVPEVE